MIIKDIKIKNLKCFGNSGEEVSFHFPDGKTLGSGLNILVGKNNSGKSTLFEAVDFLRNSISSTVNISDLKNNKNSGEEIEVEITFSGGITEIIDNFSQDNKKDTFKKYVYKENDIEQIKIIRSSSNLKEVKFWDNTKSEFKNETGIDAPMKKLFELNFVWADTNPNDAVKFGATTICGNLLREIVEDFEETDEYKGFKKNFHNTFNDEKTGLKAKLKEIEEKTQKIFLEQFGEAKISFHFDEPKVDSFFKNTKIKVHDGEETFMEEKGTGMQRSVALALLQVYAEKLSENKDNNKVLKPVYLFIDEPEVCLHPQAQKKLLNALLEISKSRQVFVSTHSPYFIEPSLIGNVLRFKNSNGIEVFADTKQELKEMKENRVFFFHHRDIFFSDKAIFLEGVTDIERLSLYCESNNFSELVEDLYFLGGCKDAELFKKLCSIFDIKSCFIFDVDYINSDLSKHIQNGDKQDKEWHRKNFNTYKTDFETKKTELQKENIFLLSRPDIMDFLNEKGEAFNGNNSKGFAVNGTEAEKKTEIDFVLNSVKTI